MTAFVSNNILRLHGNMLTSGSNFVITVFKFEITSLIIYLSVTWLKIDNK